MNRVVALALGSLFPFSMSALAAAQDFEVQWPESAGGNGHWYLLHAVGNTGISWEEADLMASNQGGYLATLTSAQENAWVYAHLASNPEAWRTDINVAGPLIGLFKEDGQWQWVTGEVLEYASWGPCYPRGGSNEYRAHFGCHSNSDVWNDLASYDQNAGGAVIEWSADCNGDGIVDYGQILDGTLLDHNQNGVPDLCEALQWSVQDNGNGHWYLAMRNLPGVSWTGLRERTESMGGHLVTITSAEESSWLWSTLVSNPTYWAGTIGPALGFFQDTNSPDFSEPSGGWRWVTDEPVEFTTWGPGEPNNGVGSEDFAYFGGTGALINSWFDGGNGGAPYFLIEWDADCNGDGVVDYGQILSGELRDLDGDGVPDTCDCRADINGDGAVTGADLGILLALWGDPSTLPSADVSGDGRLDGADLGLLLAAWGPCE